MATPFPAHNINPKYKNFSWILKYSKAVYGGGNGNMPYGSFFNGWQDYKEREDYANGNQSIDKYNTNIFADEVNDNKSNSLDKRVVPIISKFINIAVSKLIQREFDPSITCIDPQAKVDEDEWYKEKLLKLKMREAILAQGGDLSKYPQLQQGLGDPEDIEQLNIIADYGYKYKYAMDAEMVVQGTLQKNRTHIERAGWCRDLFNHGIGGARVTLNDDGSSTITKIRPDRLFVSYCEKPDFSDASYIGVATYVNIADILKYFTANQIKQITEKCIGKYGNPQSVNFNKESYYDGVKCLVLDLNFKSYNSKVFKTSLDEYGNELTTDDDYDKMPKTLVFNKKSDDEEGETENDEENETYDSITPEVMYQAMWIVDTDYMYNYGIKNKQIRKTETWSKCEFDIVLYALNFNNMKHSGITQWLMPLADEYQETHLKIQSIKRRLIPYLIAFDISALESIPWGKGGTNLKPAEIVNMAMKTYLYPYRGTDLIDGNNVRKPIEIQLTGMAQELGYLSNELKRIEDTIRSVSGLNEVTDGSTPPARMLTTGLNLANQSTNNALYFISEADKDIQIRIWDKIVMQTKMAVNMGKVKGIVKGYGKDTVQTFEISKEFDMHEYQMYWNERATMEQRQELLAMINVEFTKGLLTVSDRFLIEGCSNLKAQGLLLDYRIRKAEEKLHAKELEKINANNQGAAQAAQIAGKETRETNAQAAKNKLEEINTSKQWDYVIKDRQIEGTNQDTDSQSRAKIISAHINANAKKGTDAAIAGADTLQ